MHSMRPTNARAQGISRTVQGLAIATHSSQEVHSPIRAAAVAVQANSTTHCALTPEGCVTP